MPAYYRGFSKFNNTTIKFCSKIIEDSERRKQQIISKLWDIFKVPPYIIITWLLHILIFLLQTISQPWHTFITLPCILVHLVHMHVLTSPIHVTTQPMNIITQQLSIWISQSYIITHSLHTLISLSHAITTQLHNLTLLPHKIRTSLLYTPEVF